MPFLVVKCLDAEEVKTPTTPTMRPPRRGGAKKGPNAWQSHVRGFAKQHKLTYWQAIKDPQCSASYRK